MSDKIPSAFSSFMACKCPRCRKGNIFTHSLFSFKFHDTHTNCPHCDMQYEHETGFFWGAMYISYSFSVGLMLIVGIYAVNKDWSFENILYVILGIIIVVTPVFYRYSRALLLYMASPNRYFKKEYFDKGKEVSQ